MHPCTVGVSGGKPKKIDPADHVKRAERAGESAAERRRRRSREYHAEQRQPSKMEQRRIERRSAAGVLTRALH